MFVSTVDHKFEIALTIHTYFNFSIYLNALIWCIKLFQTSQKGILSSHQRHSQEGLLQITKVESFLGIVDGFSH